MSANQEMVCNKHFSTKLVSKANGKTEIDWIFNNESLLITQVLKRRNIRFFPFEKKEPF
jgi:hypothetical protein